MPRLFLVLFIIVKPLAGLAPQPAGFHISSQQRAGSVFRVLESVIQGLHDGKAGIQANEVGQGQRPHGMGHTKSFMTVSMSSLVPTLW